jgi:hypothetical protein
MAEPQIEPTHLGDGVYASFDGYHINLAVNHHTNHAVALEPSVMQALIMFGDQIDRTYSVERYGSRAVRS